MKRLRERPSYVLSARIRRWPMRVRTPDGVSDQVFCATVFLEVE